MRGSFAVLALAGFWLSACASQSPPAAVTLETAKREGGLDRQASARWPEADACPALLASVLAQHANRNLPVDPSDAPVVMVVAQGDAGPSLHQPLEVVVEQDLHLPVHRGGLPSPLPPCLLMVHADDDVVAAPRRIVSRRQAQSKYVSRMRHVENPAYRAAKHRLKRAEKALNGSGGGWKTMGDPLVDMVSVIVGGALSGLDGAKRTEEYETALAELAKTEPELERPVLTSYLLNVVEVAASKRSEVDVVLIDTRRRQAVEAAVAVRETRHFEMSDDLRAEDRGIGNRLASAEAIKTWERSPPPFVQSHIVARLITTGAPASFQQPGELIESWQTPAGWAGRVPPDSKITRAGYAGDQAPEMVAATGAVQDVGLERSAKTEPMRTKRPDPKTQSVVMIRRNNRVGSGFYVEPERILTSAKLIDRLGIVDVTLHDGTEILAMVEHIDRRRNLAVIRSPKPGIALPLYQGDPPKAGDWVQLLCQVADMGPMVSFGKLEAAGPAWSEKSAGKTLVRTKMVPSAAQVGGPVLVGGRVLAVSDWTMAPGGIGQVALGPDHEKIAHVLAGLKNI
ncbi:MAG: serine protease [Geminicoccaceae bacterium]